VIIDAVIKKYHLYIIGFDLPEGQTLLGCVFYLDAANMPVLIRIADFFYFRQVQLIVPESR
jgi:hypothetical protein